jgi:hypothetical protein
MPLPTTVGVMRTLLPRMPVSAPTPPTSGILNTSGQPVFNTSGEGINAA